jgi:hypothetical protein
MQARAQVPVREGYERLFGGHAFSSLLAAGMVLEKTARVGACIGGWRTMDHHEEDVQNYRRFPSICPHAHMGKAQRTKKLARRLFPFLDLLLLAKSGPNPAR